MGALAPLLGPAPPGFARAFGRATVFGYQRGVTVPLPGVAVRPFVPGTNTPWPDPLYLYEYATTPATFPVPTDATGAVALWGAEPGRLELDCSAPGYGAQRLVLDLEFPADYVDPDQATDAEVAEAVADAMGAHEAALDPHPTYATDADLAAHAGAADPHPVYLTEPEGAALFLPLAHAPGGDPHPQYTLDADLATALALYQTRSEKNQPLGYPGLDAGGKVPTAALPPLAITDVFVVNSEPEMLALNAQRGDLAVRADVNQTYVLAAEPPTVLANWVPLMGGGTAAVTSVDGRVGNVVLADVYAPLAHTTAPDPHPQYTTGDEVAGIVTGAMTVHTGDSNPHPVYATDADLAAAVARIAALETQLAALSAKLTGHLHANGTVGQIAGAATFP